MREFSGCSSMSGQSQQKNDHTFGDENTRNTNRANCRTPVHRCVQAPGASGFSGQPDNPQGSATGSAGCIPTECRVQGTPFSTERCIPTGCYRAMHPYGMLGACRKKEHLPEKHTFGPEDSHDWDITNPRETWVCVKGYRTCPTDS